MLLSFICAHHWFSSAYHGIFSIFIHALQENCTFVSIVPDLLRVLQHIWNMKTNLKLKLTNAFKEWVNYFKSISFFKASITYCFFLFFLKEQLRSIYSNVTGTQVRTMLATLHSISIAALIQWNMLHNHHQPKNEIQQLIKTPTVIKASTVLYPLSASCTDSEGFNFFRLILRLGSGLRVC